MHDMKTWGVVRYLLTLAGGREAAGLTDQQLLLRFSTSGDQTAFVVLVERHGPMVFRVCQRLLRQEQDAEDAFQATFLVLAERAHSIRKTQALASWLHGVAHRVALRARRDAERRRLHEREAQPMSAKANIVEADWREVQATLDEEIQALAEKYRVPFVLCFLEGKSRAEVACELGLKEGTVWSRLSKARKLLQEQLGRRGIALPALLAVASLSGGKAWALPGRLIESTVRVAAGAGGTACASAVSARVAALAKGVIKTMPTIKMKTVVLCLVMAGFVAFGACLVLKGYAAAQPPVKGPAQPHHRTAVLSGQVGEKAEPERSPEPAIQDSGETVTFKARVLDPDGKPLAGAEVTLWCHYGSSGIYRDWHPETATPFRTKALATSGEDGRFTATFRKAEVTENPLNMWDRPWRLVQVVAAAKGYGPAWACLESLDKGELTLRLIKDDVPVKGRVLNLEGRPVVGAAIRVARVTIGGDVHNSLWQPSWAGFTDDLRTDREGRFSLSGVGGGREVLLSIEGAGIEHKLVEVKTPAIDRSAAGPEVEISAGPTKPVEGTIVAKGTGKPLAGMMVYGDEEAHQRRVRAVTDERGHFRLVGLPKAAAYRLTVYPPMETGYLGTSRSVAGSEGLRPVTADIELRRGVEVRCRLIDKVTGEPVRGEIRYTPLNINPLYGEAEVETFPGLVPSREFQRHHVPGPDGVFRFVAYPGPGLLVVILQGNSGRYLPGRIDPADLAKAQDDPHMMFAKSFGIYRLIDPKEEGKPLVSIDLDPGRKASGSLLGPDGKPVTGALAYGLNHHPFERADKPAERLKADAFTATLLDPKQPRTVSFVHKDLKLVGYQILRGDEKGPVTVRMAAWSVLTGRLVDADGKPLPGLRIAWSYPSLPAPSVAPPTEALTTDREGRFRVEGLAPGVKFDLTLSEGGKKGPVFSAGEALKGLAIEAGQTRDLGDVRVQATPEPKKKEGGNDE